MLSADRKIARRFALRIAACAAAIVLFAAPGCKKIPWVNTRSHEFSPVLPPQNELETASPLPTSATAPYAPMDSYPLRVGDEIAFTLSVDPRASSGVYRLRVNDQISVEYLHEPPSEHRARTMRVLPNGSIDLPMIGSVTVAGSTVDEVTRDVNHRAEKYYRFPNISLTVTETSQRAEELRRAFTSGFNNQSLTVVVSPDGTINLPEAGTVHVMYRTMPEVRTQVQALYEELVPGVRVWPHLTRRAPDQIYVLGQVQTPGRLLLDRPTHVSQAIAQAGGWILSAQLNEIVLIRYREGCPQAVLLDLHSAIYQDRRPRKVDLTDDLLLADGDVVIVPRDKVQNTNDFIRRVFTEGIYGVIPIPPVRDSSR
jgi:polysaccharide export outer membrane protein